jgi:type VI secretion system FHA domain protein
MLLALSVISPQGAGLGSTAFKVFDTRGGSIGRVEANDWVLPDPDKVVSSRHASVRCVRGVFYLEDTSTNGTFVNGPDKPISKTQPAMLKDGDHLLIGDYEILVQLIDDGAPAEPESAQPDVAVVAASEASLIDAEPAADELADTLDPLALLGGAGMPSAPASAARVAVAPSPHAAPAFSPPPAFTAAAAVAPARAEEPRRTPVQPPAPAMPVRAAPVAQTAAMPSAAAAALSGDAATLLAELGLDPARVPPEIYQQLGQIVRIVVDGLIEVLHSRAEVKNSFRLAMTNMRPVENNPLKFSMNSEDALHNLFIKKNPGYLGAVDAFREGFQDIAFHQMAMLAGIRAAYEAMLEKFNPEHLEEIYERRLKRTSMLNIGGRTRYWELYRAQFEDILKDREAHFQLLFGEEFAKAYHEQLRKLATTARARQG